MARTSGQWSRERASWWVTAGLVVCVGLASGCAGSDPDVELARVEVSATPSGTGSSVDRPGGESTSSTDETARGAPGAPGGGGGSSGARGAPGGGSGGGQVARGAPVRIPSIVQDQGRPLAEVQSEITASVLEQCGGSLCLDLVVRHSDPDFQDCQFVRTEPAQESVVERGTTVVIVAGTLPCEEPSSEPDSGTTSTAPGTDGEQQGETATDEPTSGDGSQQGSETDGSGDL